MVSTEFVSFLYHCKPKNHKLNHHKPGTIFVAIAIYWYLSIYYLLKSIGDQFQDAPRISKSEEDSPVPFLALSVPRFYICALVLHQYFQPTMEHILTLCFMLGWIPSCRTCRYRGLIKGLEHLHRISVMGPRTNFPQISGAYSAEEWDRERERQWKSPRYQHQWLLQNRDQSI